MDTATTTFPPAAGPATRSLSPTKTAASGSGSSATRRHTPQSADKGVAPQDLAAMEDGSFSAPEKAQAMWRW